MRKTQILASVALLCLLFGSAAAQTAQDNALSFANVTVSPNPVAAGGNMTVRFQLYNSYNDWVYNLNVRPSGSYPILNVSPGSSYHTGILNPGLNPGYLNYTFQIPATTPSGTYTVYFNTTYYVLGAAGVYIGTSDMPLSFRVQNRPVIRLVLTSPQPAALYQGYNQTIQLAVQNTGYGTARNVSVSIGALPGTSLLGSVDNFFISNLTRGQTVDEPLLVSASNASSAGISAQVSYYSSDYTDSFSGSQVLGLSLAPAAQFTISSSGGAIAPGSTDVPVRFVITNTGTSEANQAQFSLESSYPITPVASTAYVASLPVGGSANVTFLVSADSQGVPGNYPVTVYEQWKQPNGSVNQQFSASNNYFVGVGSQGGSTVLIAAIVIVIVVGGVAVYRYRMRARGAKKPKK
ncbi:MAG: hypothetical protein KGH58_01625 [Candidatus Micrarchaeota archaeon]|nr:hypothetical protein [Candidatus Micrarchaeota archaeon]